eukprot:4314545-Lingulodinium_polyedra.AAC.1
MCTLGSGVARGGSFETSRRPELESGWGVAFVLFTSALCHAPRRRGCFWSIEKLGSSRLWSSFSIQQLSNDADPYQLRPDVCEHGQPCKRGATRL